jgi:hypothetical protein
MLLNESLHHLMPFGRKAGLPGQGFEVSRTKKSISVDQFYLDF